MPTLLSNEKLGRSTCTLALRFLFLDPPCPFPAVSTVLHSCKLSAWDSVATAACAPRRDRPRPLLRATPDLISTGRFNCFEVVITNYITVTVAGLFFLRG